VKILKIKNIIPVLISFIIIFSGSFSIALMHYSCVSDGYTHMECDTETEDACCEQAVCCEFPGIHEEMITKMDCCEIHAEKYEHSEPYLPIIKDSKVKLYSQYYCNNTIIIKHSDQSEINSYQYNLNFSLRDVCTLNSSFRI